MTKRINIASGAPWEDIVGYSRAVRVDNVIEVTGTVAVENGKVVGKDDAYLQAKKALQIIEKVLKDAGGSMEDVVRTRMYVTDIGRWEEVGKAHYEFFGDIRPATTMVEVSKLIHPDYLIEIEARAVL